MWDTLMAVNGINYTIYVLNVTMRMLHKCMQEIFHVAGSLPEPEEENVQLRDGATLRGGDFACFSEITRNNTECSELARPKILS